MAYRSFHNHVPHGGLSLAPNETAVSGVSVARIDIPIDSGYSAPRFVDEFSDSDFDAAIVRVPSSDFGWGWALMSAGLEAWQADTLLYWRTDLQSPVSRAASVEMGHASPDDRAIVESVVVRTFTGYTNHYSTSPLFFGVAPAVAYAEWVVGMLQSPHHEVLIARDREGSPVGICAVELADPNSDSELEIVLAGVVPESRRLGLYTGMLSEVFRRYEVSPRVPLVISTQAANTAVMAAWSKLGLIPVLSLNTLHVLKSGVAVMLRSRSPL